MRLAGSGSTMEPFPPKPKRMRWETYFRLWARSIGARNACVGGLTVQLDRQARRGARVAEQALRRRGQAGSQPASRGRALKCHPSAAGCPSAPRYATLRRSNASILSLAGSFTSN